jgi:hypothetical protein
VFKKCSNPEGGTSGGLLCIDFLVCLMPHLAKFCRLVHLVQMNFVDFSRVCISTVFIVSSLEQWFNRDPTLIKSQTMLTYTPATDGEPIEVPVMLMNHTAQME